MKDDNNGPTTDTTTKNIDYYANIMRQKVTLCNHVTLISYTKVRAKVVTKIIQPHSFGASEFSEDRSSRPVSQ